MKNKLGLVGAALAASLFVLPGAASAQNYPPPGGGPGAGPGGAPPGPQQDERGFWPRRGIYGGVGLGVGQLSYGCDGCDDLNWSAIGFHGHFGFRFNPQIGIFADGYGLGADISDEIGFDAILVNAMWNFGAQYWITPPLWIKGGIGVARQQISTDEDTEDSDSASSILLAIGYEVLHSPNFSIDIDFRVGAGFYDEEFGGTVTNVGLQFSVNWHSLWSGAAVVVY
jgi:hypothetical protein